MELRQLEHFVNVADERHFTRAAELLRISQSGLSASIRALEIELGTSLFVRSTRRVELTAAGTAFLVEARRTLASAAAAQNAVAAVRGLVRGRLTVGAEPCLGSVDIPSELARFRAANAGVELRLRYAGSSELMESIAAGKMDVALVVDTGETVPGVRLRPLSRQSLVVLCHPDHAFASSGGVTVEDLAAQSLIGFHAGWGAHSLAARAFAAAGFDYRTSLEVNDVHPLLDLIGHNLGVAVVPASFAAKRPDTLVSVPLAAAPAWVVAVAVAEEASPAATAFLDQLVIGAPNQDASSAAISSAESVSSTA